MMGNAALASPDLFEPKPRYIATRPPLTRGEHAFPKWQRIHSRADRLPGCERNPMRSLRKPPRSLSRTHPKGRAAPARNFVTASTRIR